MDLAAQADRRHRRRLRRRHAEILASIDHPDLFVLRRDKPDAQKGKAAALNYAYRSLREHPDRERTIVVIVDADGRLRPDAPQFASGHFDDPEVGGVQSLVRIYNRDHLLTWSRTSSSPSTGTSSRPGATTGARPGWAATASSTGSARSTTSPTRWPVAGQTDRGPGPRPAADRGGLGGAAGPARDRSTSRASRSRGRCSASAPAGRRATCRRSALAARCWRAPFPLGARIEQLALPLHAVLAGDHRLGLLGALFSGDPGRRPFWGGGPTWQLVFFYLLAFGGTSLGCVAAAPSRARAAGFGFLIGQVYTLYTWFLWPVLVRSTVRQLSARDDWAKTEREPIEGPGPDQSPNLV